MRMAAALFIVSALVSPSVNGQDRFAELRNRMVDVAIQAEGITSPAVLMSMRKVPRHEFVSGLHRASAYEDHALPIGAQQTISPPYVVAYMTETLDPQPGDKVLEIGTGSGYQAAVLAEIVREVYTIEIVPALAQAAERRLRSLGYENVHVMEGDGYKGWPDHAPFDRIIVTCSPEDVPAPLTEQLKEGGRMVIPVGERYQQAFHLLRKHDGKLEREKLLPTLFVPMTGESEKQRQVLPDAASPRIVNGSFELDENEDGRVDGWHYQRQASLCTEEPMDGVQCLRFENQTAGHLAQALQGMALDGQKIRRFQLNYWVRHESIAPGPAASDQAGVVIHFYDRNRREIHTEVHGRWRGSLGWQHAKSEISVPVQAREVIIRLGLNGAVGTLDVDGMQLETDSDGN